MAVIETKVRDLVVHRREIPSPVTIEIPTAWKRKLGEELCLRDEGSSFRWVRVMRIEGDIRELNNPVPNWVSLKSRIPFTSRRLRIDR